MIKKFIAAALCVALAVTVVGCNKKENPEELVRKLTAKIAESKYLDTNVNATVSMNTLTTGTQKINLNSNAKVDMNGEFPKVAFDGTIGIENMVNVPVKLYMDENNTTITIMNQTQQLPMPDQLKQQLKKSNKSGNINDNIGKHVEETEYNGSKALKVNYDLQQINSLASASLSSQPSAGNSINISKMDVYYVMSDNKENINAIILDLDADSNGESISMHMDITINSTDQPFQLTPPETTTSITPPTQMAA